MSTTMNECSTSILANGSIAGRIEQLRRQQSELRGRPVTGSFSSLKKIVYKIVHSTFTRQFQHNASTVDLIESVYHQLLREQQSLHQQSRRIRAEVERIVPAEEEGVAIETGEVLASCGQTQDQAKLNNIRSLIGFNAVYTSPAELRMPERVTLYSLVFSLQPQNCLEIGTFRGGSTAIICGAMDDTGFGQLACVDPMPQVAPELWLQIEHRCRMFKGPSPDVLPEVARQTGAKFDFVFIDANHTYENVQRDILGVLPLLSNRAYLLFHDAHSPGVKQAIDEAVKSDPELTDCGIVSVEPTVLHDNGQPVYWAGLRLLRFQRARA
jgi:predicted O-methyltransferase YrrM